MVVTYCMRKYSPRYYKKNIITSNYVRVLFRILSVVEVLGIFILLMAIGQIIKYFLPCISTKITQVLTKLKINKFGLIISRIGFDIIVGTIFTIVTESILLGYICISELSEAFVVYPSIRLQADKTIFFHRNPPAGKVSTRKNSTI